MTTFLAPDERATLVAERLRYGGLCACGCGRTTAIANVTRRANGDVAGFPRLYVGRHRRRAPATQYRQTVHDGIPIREHIAVVERALGKRLPAGAQVHHVNGIKSDNRNSNLVVCQDAAYHRLLHYRQRAKAECGNPNYVRCHYCKKWEPPDQLHQVTGRNRFYYHRPCTAAARRGYGWKPGGKRVSLVIKGKRIQLQAALGVLACGEGQE